MPSASAAPETLPPPAAGADEIRRAADEILARPEFQEPPRTLYQRVLDEVGERLGALIDLLVSGGRGAILGWLVLAVVVGASAFLVLRGLRLGRGARRAPEGGAVEVERRRPPGDWAAEAARFEAAGAWRDAIRCRYRWLIATLAGAGVVDDVPGRTAGEYRSLVTSARPAVEVPFADATDLFERTWYGEEPAGPDEASSLGDLAERVVAGAQR